MNHIRRRQQDSWQQHPSSTPATQLQQPAQLTCCRDLRSASNHDCFDGEGGRNFELAPIILGDVENVDVVHCEESVTGLQIKADVISEDQPQSIFPNFSFADVIVRHTRTKQKCLVCLADQIVQAGQTAGGGAGGFIAN